MLNHFSPSQQAVIDQDARQQAAAGFPLSQTLNDLYAQIATGTIGIKSLAADIDSLALGGGAFTIDLDTSPGTSLNFSWKTGHFHNGYTLVTVAGGTIALSPSATNYVEVNRAGVVSSNTAGFTGGRLPLYIVVTGVSTWDPVAGVTLSKPLLTLISANGVSGAMLSTAAQTKELNAQLGTITATASFLVIAPNVAATLVAAELVEAATIAASDANNWTFAITNLGAGGVGTTAMLNTGAVNTTKATGGSGLTANVPRALTLHGVPGSDGNLNTNPNDVLQVTFTISGAPGNLTAAALRLDFTFQT